MGIMKHFSEIEDHRASNARRHDLHELLMIALCSCLCGGLTCVDMADYAEDNEPFLREFLTLKNGLPTTTRSAGFSAASTRRCSAPASAASWPTSPRRRRA